MLFTATAGAQAPGETAAYNNVRQARDLVRSTGSATLRRGFTRQAEEFVKRYPESTHNPTVYLWLGDLLRDSEPRRAFAFYRLSGLRPARQRADNLAFRFEPPPRLQVERWVGKAVDPTRPADRVTFVAFFQQNHPQTRPLLGRVEHLAALFGQDGDAGKGERNRLRVVGVAALVDDHMKQKPGSIEAWLKRRQLPFPVAIDRQRPNGGSVSLSLYRGKIVPWGVFLDRYGRIVWVGSLSLEKNALQRCETKLRALLSDPSYQELRDSARTGNEAAVRKLGAIKTRESVTSLFAIRAAKPPERIRPLIDKTLRAILPEGFGPEDEERWSKVRNNYRYSFEDDKLVRRHSVERTPTTDR
ncbi:MAG: TlpA family protein disulfide reductase [Planctomycetota bacterium]|jgi:hypothetical protein